MGCGIAPLVQEPEIDEVGRVRWVELQGSLHLEPESSEITFIVLDIWIAMIEFSVCRELFLQQELEAFRTFDVMIWADSEYKSRQ